MKFYMFQAVPLPIIRSLFTVHLALVCHTGLMTAFKWDQREQCSILVLLESCLQTCMTYTIAECRVNKLLVMGRGTARNM